MKYIVDGTADYDADNNVFAGLGFSGTLTNVKNKKKYNFSFYYKANQEDEDWEDMDWMDWEGDFEEDNIEGIAMEVVGHYEFAFYSTGIPNPLE